MTNFHRVATCKEMIALAIDIIGKNDPMFEKTIIDCSVKSDDGNISFDPRLLIDVPGKDIQVITLNAMNEEPKYFKRTEAYSRAEALKAEIVNVACVSDFNEMPVKETKEEKQERLIDECGLDHNVVFERHPRYETKEDEIWDCERSIKYHIDRVFELQNMISKVEMFIEKGGNVRNWINNKRVLSPKHIEKAIARNWANVDYYKKRIAKLEGKK